MMIFLSRVMSNRYIKESHMLSQSQFENNFIIKNHLTVKKYREEYITEKCNCSNNVCVGWRAQRKWPTEDRIDIIGQNGNTGEHYEL